MLFGGIALAKKICGYCFHASGGKNCRFCGKPLSRTTAEYDALPLGTRLDNKYIVGRVLGRGGFGIIYLVYDEKNDRAAAVKEYFPERIAVRAHNNIDTEPITAAHSEEFTMGADRFMQEAQLISRFWESSEILGIYDVFRQNGTVYYTMDYIKGVSLKRLVSEHGVLTPAQSVFIAEKLLGALKIIHSEDVLHRDISPDNIMLCPDGSVRLIDFGSARVIPDETKSLSIILKAGFAPLEQYRRKGGQGSWTDLYSLSMSLFFGLTGEEPEDSLSRLDDDSFIHEKLKSVPQELSAAIIKGGEVKAENRFRSADEMLTAVKACGIAPQPIDPELCRPNDSEQKISTGKKGGKKPLVFVGAAAALTTIFGVLALSHNQPQMVKIGGEFFSVDLTSLDLSNRELTNQQIFNLSHMKKLTYLDVSGNYITDLSYIKGLTELETLSFSNNNIQDISFAQDMMKLRSFIAENCGISDISVLADKELLENVFIGDNYVTDISPLKNCSRLVQIGFNEAQIGNIDALENKTSLEKVCLTGCSLTSIEPLRECNKLKYVYLGRNNLSDLSPLSGCDIAELYIDNNKLSGNTDSFRGITVNGFVCMEGNGFTDAEISRLSLTILNGDFELYY